MIKTMIKLFISFSVIFSIYTENKFLSNDSKLRVRLLVFSGTKDPEIILSEAQIEKLTKLIKLENNNSRYSTRVMGYKGFLFIPINSNFPINLIKGIPSAEIYLLDIFKHLIAGNVFKHILEQIITEYITNNEQNHQINNQANNLAICENIPIIGPDTVPEYNPHTDDFGCFEKYQWDNNCYNYGNDIVTNSYAQPGRGTDHIWKKNTCDEVKQAAISDGLIWMGKSYPKDVPEVGHYVALLIWPNTNFHWVRLDSSNVWSHKPGGTEIRNTDNANKVINDPSEVDLSPWTEFCGYFLTLPSKISIN